MKNKKGFTLIELLAVIVILAIIALIAVPVIMNIINKSNKSAFKDTAYGILNAGELYFAEQQLEPNGMTEDEVTFELPLQANTETGIQIKGQVPNGTLKVNKEGKVAFALYNGRYCAKKEYTDNDVIIIENLDECNLGIPTIGELESRYNFNYYSSLAQAVADVNNNEIGINSNSDKESAVAGVYTTNGQTYVALLKDTTEEISLQISADMTLNLGGHKLTMSANDSNGIVITAENTIIDGRLPGSMIVNSLITDEGPIGFIQADSNTNLVVAGGTYYVGHDDVSSYGFYIKGKAKISNAVINANTKMFGTLGIYVLETGDATITDCDIVVQGTEDTAYTMYGIYVAGVANIENSLISVTNPAVGGRAYGIYNYGSATATISNSKIKAVSYALGSAVFGIYVANNSNATVTNCNIIADGFSDYVPEGEVAAKAVSVYAISSSSGSTITINDGYYWGAREALGIHGTARINGGVYEGPQHGGAYFSGNDIKVKNAIFRNVDYTGEVGWVSTNWHGAAVYCGSGSRAVNVYFDNCRFESNVSTVQGIVAKYTNTNVYLSNSVIDGNFGTVLRVDHPTNYLYIGENVSCDITSFVGDGHLDTTTYAGQNFGNW